MNLTIPRFALSCILCLGTLTTAVAQAPDIDSMDIVTRSVPDGPVALVGKNTVDRIDFVLLYQANLARYAARTEKEVAEVSELDRVRVGFECMTELIEQELLYQHALSQNIKVDKELVKQRAQQQFDSVKQGLSESAGKEVSDAEVIQRLSYNSRQDIDAEIERSMIIAKMRETIVKDHVTNLSPEELDRIYEKNVDKLVTPDAARLKQIFVRVPKDDADAGKSAKKRADEALGRIFSGQTFDSVAKEFSDIPNETNMGLVPLNKLPDYLRQPVGKMKANDISDVIEGPHGYHILQLIESVAGSSMTKDQAQDTIRYQMAVNQGGTVIRDFCAKLIEEGKTVTVFLELEHNLMLLNGGELPAE